MVCHRSAPAPLAPPDRQPDLLNCAAALGLGGLSVFNSATATSTALGSSGLISNIAKLEACTVDANLRLAYKPAGNRGYALTPDGLLALRLLQPLCQGADQ